LWRASPFVSKETSWGRESVNVAAFASALIIGAMPYDSGRTRADLIVPDVFVTATSTGPPVSKTTMPAFEYVSLSTVTS
jgi:hypothetical protein